MTAIALQHTLDRVIGGAWNAGDLTAIDECVHPDYIRHTAQGDLLGPAGFKELITSVRTAFPDFHCTIEEVIVDGDRSSARFTNRGTHLGAFFGIAPTFRQVEFTNSVFVHYLDGMLHEEWEFLDSATILGPLTGEPNPAAAASTAR